MSASSSTRDAGAIHRPARVLVRGRSVPHSGMGHVDVAVHGGLSKGGDARVEAGLGAGDFVPEISDFWQDLVEEQRVTACVGDQHSTHALVKPASAAVAFQTTHH